MKKLFTTFLLTAFSLVVFAQKVKVTESSERIGGGSKNALVVSIYEASPEVIEKEVKSLLKDYDAKVSSQDGGLFGDNAMIKKMGANTVDIYAKWEKVKDGEVRLCMAFDMGGSFVSSSGHHAEFEVAKDIVERFASKSTGEAIHEMVKVEQKTFEKLSDEQKKLEKENKSLNDDIIDYNKKIEEYNQKIKKAQQDIEVNNTSQGKKKGEVEAQQKVLEVAKGKEKMIN